MANQHFVPQFYFKQFTKGRPQIHLLLKSSDRIVLHAPIKGQCARNGFYGPKELETAISKIEQDHAASVRRGIASAWSTSIPLDESVVGGLMHAVVFQRARTQLEVEKITPSRVSLVTTCFREYVAHQPNTERRKEMLEALDSGQVEITATPQSTVLLSMQTALEAFPLVTDLDVHLLRNNTDFPFVFSDSPVAFYNSYLRNVTTRGVLGYQTPGIQIFWPLDSRTMLMLSDDEQYEGPYKDRIRFDVAERSDVSQLNALQVHHSHNAIYFADKKHAEYVRQLWNAHKPTVSQPISIFRKMDDALIDGKPCDGTLFHTFEPQLNHRLHLSFVQCEPIKAQDYRFRRRNPELVQEVKKELDLEYPA